jgi:UDP-N-acetylmuramate dehydrogenase
LGAVPSPVLTRSLAPHTTLRVGGPADRLLVARTAGEVVEAVRAADAAGEPLLLLGGGSNVVIADEGVPGVALLVRSTGHTVEPLPDGAVLVTVEAGEDWDALVAATVGMGLGGLECLSGIPGSTGATPVQNVGAYGVEVADVLVDVDLYDRRAGELRLHVPTAELGLGYRASVLKHRDDAVVLRVRFRLRPDGTSAPIRYPELARALGVAPDTTVAAGAARMAVLDLRRGKGMVLDPADHDTWSVGSFFTNPVVPAAEFDRIRNEVEGPVPNYPAPDGVKLAAGWLVERAGFPRGYPGDGAPVRLSTKHALALTNRGGARAADVIALARTVRDGVRTTFGVDLVPEPILIGCAL